MINLFYYFKINIPNPNCFFIKNVQINKNREFLTFNWINIYIKLYTKIKIIIIISELFFRKQQEGGPFEGEDHSHSCVVYERWAVGRICPILHPVVAREAVLNLYVNVYVENN